MFLLKFFGENPFSGNRMVTLMAAYLFILVPSQDYIYTLFPFVSVIIL